MSQQYSNPKRANDTYALPDVETFTGYEAECEHCGQAQAYLGAFNVEDTHCTECGKKGVRVTDTARKWYWWSCFPGCLPDSEPFGPFATEAEAIADAQDNAIEDEDEDEGNQS